MKTLKTTFITATLLCLAGAGWAQERKDVDKNPPISEVNESTETVIIDGRWGTAPSQFGTLGPREEEALGFSNNIFSVAVACNGTIYILDPLNNRIQKFDFNGKHLKDIPVDGCIDAAGKSCVKATHLPNNMTRFDGAGVDLQEPIKHGVNIIIDSHDILYYYLLTKTDGEIWRFRDDTLLDKSTAPVSEEAQAGLGLTLDADKLWLFNIRDNGKYRSEKNFDFRSRQIYTAQALSDWRTRERKTAGLGECSPKQKLKSIQLKVTEDGLLIIRRIKSQ